VQPTSPEEHGVAEVYRFIELMAPAAADIAECVVELEGAGRKDANPDEGHRSGGVGGIEPDGVVGQVMIQITPQMRILVANPKTGETSGPKPGVHPEYKQQ